MAVVRRKYFGLYFREITGDFLRYRRRRVPASVWNPEYSARYLIAKHCNKLHIFLFPRPSLCIVNRG